MLITLCYVYLWVRFQKCYSVVIQKTLRRQYAQNNSISFTFSVFNSKPEHDDGRRQPTDKQDIQTCVEEEEETMLLQLRDKAVYITKPQVCLDLSRWTVIGSSMVAGMRIDNISFVVEATLGNEIVQPSPQTSNKKVLKWSDYCIPLACSPGPPFKAVAQASVDNFGRLGVAFMEDRLQLDNGLMPSKIVSVILQESTLNTLLKRQPPHGHGGAISPPPNNSQTLKPFAESAPFNRLVEDQQKKCRKGSLLPVPEALRRLEERRGSEPLGGARDRGSTTGREDPSSASHDHPEGHGHHLHLASCHECLELENSTILSVKYASAENIPNLPHDDSACSDGGENLNGFEDDAEGRASGDVEVGGKPPNVLVYTGGRQERYRVVKQLLTECIDMDRYVVYPLQPQQALSDPWLQSTRLLVLAEEEPLAPQLQARFLGYLHQGGRVLGLSSSLCPAGLSLEAGAARRGRVERLSFTREDSTEVELSVMASGSVFARDTGGGGEVELWGELKQDAPQGHSDMVIIRITHGDDEGEAVLCQVHLEMAANREDVTAEGVDELKASDALRYEVLTEILTSLGLSCHLNQAPAPAPVYLLSASQEGKASFLKWLNGHAGDDGRLKLPKASLRVTTHAQLRDGPAPDEGSLALVPDPPPSLSLEHFDLETYRKHLRTRTLGRTVLFSDVIPTTMDLLEGLMLHVPEDVGLIAVAGQQSQGRGRGGNAWLSPRGCAMFTLYVKVPLDSRLGQRIPFLQHLAALAVVEAVRTLPGYQDIDLRVKWPNDIYYDNRIKLGGVLVTSTLMGPHFHLLVGCGFNVSNSNPTVCINDLVSKHNREHGTRLEALSSTQLIACTVTILEGLIAAFQEKGADAALPIYYKRWMHSGTRVRLWSVDGPEAEVVGLDDNGFLQVYCKEQGVVSVEPDGNSFDMLMNLVVTKQR